MGERGAQLLDAADRQISELIELLSTAGDAALKLPCPGREKLGDGTVGATASHTADRYLHIAEFLKTTVDGRRAHTPRAQRGNHGAENLDPDDLLERLSAARDALGLLAELSDEQLDAVPPAGDMRFCDGRRTLEQIMAGLFKHQRHQVDAVKRALG
jgi:hypothetical protein